MTSNTDRPDASPVSDNEQVEQRMRRALGLNASGGDHAGGTHQPRAEQPAWTGHGSLQPKRRFVRDGEVPVVLLQGRREAGGHDPSLSGRLATAEAALNVEQEARKTADKSLAEALARVLDLRTELGHAKLTSEETRNALRIMESERQDEATAHAATRAELARSQAEHASTVETLRLLQTPPAAKPARATVAPAARPKPAAKAQKPVKWWIKPIAAT